MCLPDDENSERGNFVGERRRTVCIWEIVFDVKTAHFRVCKVGPFHCSIHTVDKLERVYEKQLEKKLYQRLVVLWHKKLLHLEIECSNRLHRAIEQPRVCTQTSHLRQVYARAKERVHRRKHRCKRSHGRAESAHKVNNPRIRKRGMQSLLKRNL